MLEDQNYLKIIAWLLGAGGVMFTIIGGLVSFIFKEHVRDNDSQFSKNREDHREIFGILRTKKDKK